MIDKKIVSLNNNNNNNNFFILGKQIYNKIVAKIIKNNRIPKIKQTKYNIINRTKMLNRLVFHLTDQYRNKPRPTLPQSTPLINKHSA